MATTISARVSRAAPSAAPSTTLVVATDVPVGATPAVGAIGAEPIARKSLLGAAATRPSGLAAVDSRPFVSAPPVADRSPQTIADWADYVRDCLVAVEQAPGQGGDSARAIVNLRIAVKAASDALAKAGSDTPDADKRMLDATLAIARETLEAHRAQSEARATIIKIQRAFQAQLDRRASPTGRRDEASWAAATQAFFEVWRPRLSLVAPQLSDVAGVQLGDAVATASYDTVAAVLRAVITELDTVAAKAAAPKKK